jgi:bifunctional non-homologous end joining protein LigD
VLVRTRRNGGNAANSWLLIKHRDKYASEEDITVAQPRSALTRRLLVDIAREEGGDVARSAKGDPSGSAPLRSKGRGM